jgi:mannopine transport system permease protein
VFVLPLGWLLWVSLTHGSGAANYSKLLGRSAGRHAFENTAVLSTVVTAVALIIGGFIAWELRSSRSRIYKAVLWAALLLPLWTSVIVRNYALTLVLHRRGFVNDVLQALHVTNGPAQLLYTKAAVALGMVHSMIPYAALPLYAAFVLIDDELLAAARSLGASPFRSFVTIVLPLALPSLLATATLVFVVSTGFFVTPVVLGGPQNIFVATLIDQQVNTLFNLPSAAASAFLLLAAGLVVVAAASAVVGWRRLEKALG